MPWSVLMDRRPEERIQSKAEGELRIEGATPCSVVFALSLVGKSITSLNRPFQAKVGSLWSQLPPCNFGTHLIRAAVSPGEPPDSLGCGGIPQREHLHGSIQCLE